MLRWALLFLVIALVSAVLGFTTIAGQAMWAAQIVFYVFIILFIISLVLGRGSPRGDVI
jgi:uncharacterized membrane protein YtjA (UPF0391 family)